MKKFITLSLKTVHYLNIRSIKENFLYFFTRFSETFLGALLKEIMTKKNYFNMSKFRIFLKARGKSKRKENYIKVIKVMSRADHADLNDI